MVDRFRRAFDVVAPKVWYIAFWLFVGLAWLLASRLFLVNPILQALKESRW